MTTTILHVVESYGGGVSSALANYVRSTPHLDHHLLCTDRTEALADSRQRRMFASIRPMPKNPLAAMRSIRASARSLGATVVHAHSSWAGVFVRLSLRNRADCRLVYTPHCFAFERTDITRWQSSFFLAVERLLSINTEVVAACSAREEVLGNGMYARRGAVFVPNVGAVRGSSNSSQEVQDRPQVPVVAAVGRLSAQKDPRFFVDVVRVMRDKGIDFQAKWIGGGPSEMTRVLEMEEIEVTGWLAREDVVRHLEVADVYLHTAAWEGFPMAILEAAELGLPIAARRIPALDGVSDDVAVQDAAALADICAGLVEREGKRAENRHHWARHLAPNTQTNQHQSLVDIYSNSADLS